MCKSLVEIKVCTLKFLEFFNESTHFSKSFFTALANPQGTVVLSSFDISDTASKSPGDAAGKPASNTSTPNS